MQIIGGFASSIGEVYFLLVIELHIIVTDVKVSKGENDKGRPYHIAQPSKVLKTNSYNYNSWSTFSHISDFFPFFFFRR